MQFLSYSLENSKYHLTFYYSLSVCLFLCLLIMVILVTHLITKYVINFPYPLPAQILIICRIALPLILKEVLVYCLQDLAALVIVPSL